MNPSDTVGRYRLDHVLGRGGGGEVWKAWDPELGRWAALKFLTGDDVERFVREARTAAQLSHANIAAVYEATPEYIAMQYVDGVTLQAHPRGDRRGLVRLVRDAARAVSYAHERGVIHRDLKPENLMVEQGRVFVMDFGLARRVEAAHSMSGMAVGTPAYMPPEQARGEAAGERSDVYGLGATLYEILTGRPPHEGRDVYSLLVKVIDEEPARPRLIDPAIDADLETIVLKCLDKAPERRYGSAAALADDLDRWLQGEAVAARPASRLYRLRKMLSKRKALTATVGALIVLAVAAGVALSVQASGASARLAKEEGGRREAVEREREDRRRRVEGLQRLAALWNEIVMQKRDMRALAVPAEEVRGGVGRAVEAVGAYVSAWPDEPQGYYVRARGRMYLGQLDESERDLRVAVAKREDFRPGWSLLGTVKVEKCARLLVGPPETSDERMGEMRGLVEEALRAFGKGWERGREREESERWGLAWTREDEVALQLAQAFRARYIDGREQESVQILEAALAQYRSEEYLRWLALWATRPEQQAAWRDEAISRAPGFAELYFDRGNAREKAGDPAGAVKDYGRALELRPDHVEARINRANALGVLGSIQDALKDYSRAIELRPDDPVVYGHRALARLKQADYQGAVADWDRAIALKRDYARAYVNRGGAKLSLGDTLGAIADYDLAIGIKADFAEAWLNRGLAEAKLRRLDRARADLDRTIALNGSIASAWYNRGTVRNDLGDREGAVADWDRAIALKADYVEAYVNRGMARMEAGNLDGAIEDFERAVALNPAHPAGRFNRGVVRHRRHDFEGAIADYEATLRLAPADWPKRATVEGYLKRARQGK